MNAHFIQKIDQLSIYANEWNRLALAVPSPLLTYDWVLSAVEAFHSQDDLSICIFNKGPHIRAIVPLVSQKIGMRRYLRLIGVEQLGEPCGILHDKTIAFKEIIRTLESRRLPLYLERIPERQVKTACSLRPSISAKGIRFSKPTNATRYLPIKSDWISFWNSLPSKRRNDIRRARKKAEAHGRLESSINIPTEQSIGSDLAQAFEIEHSSWKGANGTSIKARRRLHYFFSTFARRAQAKGWLRIGFLWIGNQAVASIIGLEMGDTFWLLKVGYDHRWAKCSPGILLVTEAIQYAFENNIRVFEFLGSDEPWLRTWVRNDCVRYYGLYAFYPFRMAGFISLAGDTIRRLKNISTAA
jgi:CelD/BcsL family acetyltransferase involved in cellulose biosynthesis